MHPPRSPGSRQDWVSEAKIALLSYALSQIWVWFALALVLLLAGRVEAASLVWFANSPDYSKPSLLSGYFVQPEGPGPFPAVVVLHGCGGISGHSISIADELSRWGYAALAVDSLGPRGMRDACGQFFIGQVSDAVAAAAFLAQQSVVDRARIAILGQSMGGSSALSVIERGSRQRPSSQRFVAVIAYYPACRGHSPDLSAPTLILSGGDDDLNRADACREMVKMPHPNGAEVELVDYPGTYHAFDVDWFQPGKDVRGHWFEYNASAANDARSRVRDFLERNFKH